MEEFASDLQHMKPQRTARRPLLGLTILLVEDSRYFSDAVRLLAVRSGARLRRADCLRSARKHIRLYRPDVVLVDLGLPDGSGLDLIKEIAAGGSLAPSVIATSGQERGDVQTAAIGHGARCFIEKPFFDLASFQQTVLSVLGEPNQGHAFSPRVVGEAIEPDVDAFWEDIQEVDRIFDTALPNDDRDLVAYTAQFLHSVARVAVDRKLIVDATTLMTALKDDNAWRDCVVDLQSTLKAKISTMELATI